MPYPFAAGGHQMKNARDLEAAGACLVVPDAEADTRLIAEIATLAGDPERRERMGRAARERSTPDAAARIWRECRELLGEEAA